jgi:hypothetical protein
VKGAAQTVGGGLPARVGPQEIHRLLSVHAMARSQGQELHQGGCLPQAPGILVMILEPTLTRKLPSNHTLMVLRFLPRATSDRLTRSEEPIHFLSH